MRKQTHQGFGVRADEIDPHHFTVTVSGPANPVVITEIFGLHGGTFGLPDFVVRCNLPYPAWGGIANEAGRDLNERLKEKKLPAGRWLAGTTKVDRLLGRELCVLAWAIEAAPKALVPNAIRNWVGMTPEGRWWLFMMAASTTGTAEDVDIGWRKAIRIALTENPTAEEVADLRKNKKPER